MSCGTCGSICQLICCTCASFSYLLQSAFLLELCCLQPLPCMVTCFIASFTLVSFWPLQAAEAFQREAKDQAAAVEARATALQVPPYDLHYPLLGLTLTSPCPLAPAPLLFPLTPLLFFCPRPCIAPLALCTASYRFHEHTQCISLFITASTSYLSCTSCTDI